MNQILHEVQERFGEWLEMAGDNAPALTIQILSNMFRVLRIEKDYLETTVKCCEGQLRRIREGK
jgi:hypothetical protein